MCRAICFLIFGCLPLLAIADSSVTASWSAPTTTASGQPLSPDKLWGYRLSYDCGQDPAVVFVQDPRATEITISDLPNAVCSFSVAAFDDSGVPSSESETVTLDLSADGPAPPINFGAIPVSKMPATVEACIADPNCKVAVQGEWQ